jgi:TolB-like protein
MNSILSELRRRNVFRVAAAYLVVGWIVMQVASTIGSAAGLPDWADSFALIILVAGFPVVLFIAWAFELTPEGMKKTEAVDEPVGFRPLGPSDYLLLAGVIVVLGVAGFQFATRGQSVAGAPDGSPLAELLETPSRLDASIAVLPFADLSPDGDQAYFGDGIAEEILNVLTRVDGLHVASRTSAFQFRGDQAGIPAIARQLNVRHVVEGSVRKAGDTLRITAQLIDSDGDRHLWSDTFDRPLTAENIFAIQDEIATEIVDALSEALGVDAPNVSVEAETENLDAYELFLQGQAIFHARDFDNILEGVEVLERAVAADPEFARAWAMLAAITSVTESWIGSVEGRDFTAEAEAAANRASELNPLLSLPFAVRGAVAQDRLEWAQALDQTNQAIALDPASANAWYFRGATRLAAGYFDTSASDFEACLIRDPAYEICRRHLAFANLYRGNTDRALDLYEQSTLAGQNSLPGMMLPVYFARGNEAAGIYNLAYLASMFDQPWIAEYLYIFFSEPDASNEELLQMAQMLHLTNTGSMDGFVDPDFDFSDPIESRNNHNPFWNPFYIDRIRPGSRDNFLAARRAAIIEMRLPEFWGEHGFPPQCRPVGDDDFECGWIDTPESAP